MTYADKLIILHEKTNMSSSDCCTVLVNGLPHKLRKDLAKLPEGEPRWDVLHLAGLITHIGSILRSNHCNILYIAVIALSLC